MIKYEILTLLCKYLDEHPDIRFTQALYNLRINEKLEIGSFVDNHSDTDDQVLNRMQRELSKTIEDKFKEGRDDSFCNMCGQRLVRIRGSYPLLNSEGEIVCPCCLKGRLDRIHHMSSEHYLKTSQESK